MSAQKPKRRTPFSWRLADQRLSIQFVIAGGLVVAFSALSLTLLLQQARRQADASRFLAQTHRTIGRLNTLGRDFYRQQTALREYVRTRENFHLANFLDGRQLWDEGYRAIQYLVTDTPAQVELLKATRESYQGWTEIAEALMKPEAKVDSNLLSEEGALFRQAFLLIDRMIDKENRMLTIRDEDDKQAIQNTSAAIATITVALLLIFGVVLTELYIWIAKPISALSRVIQRYRSGDFTVRVPQGVSTGSEIGFLQASFNQMAERIEDMVSDLRKLDQLKTDFLSTVSHELRTPLTSIGGYVKLLVSGDAGAVNETQKEFLFIIDTNVVRLTHLINDILDVEKMQSGKMELEREPQDLVGILRECRDTFDILAKQKNLELCFNVPHQLLTVLGDRDRLVQVFMNLLSNAIKYTKSGAVEVMAEQTDYAILIRVRDTGVGISKEEQEKLFQKFYRARSGLASEEGGTGLGLVIVRGLVEAHNGTIAVDSEPGRGTTFTVTLPVSDNIVSSIEAIEPTPVAERAPEAWIRPVWVIDRDQATVSEIKKILDQAAYLFSGFKLAVRSFASVDELPEVRSRSEAPALIVFDPATSSDGELVRISSIRKRVWQTVPVLMLSENVSPGDAFAEGAAAALSKPIERDRFLDTAKNLVTMKGWRILLADGNTDLRLLIKRAFEQRGIQVDDVDRGNLVLGRLDNDYYDLALIDIRFPDISGLEIVKAIRRRNRYPTLPIFLMSDEDRNLPKSEELTTWGVSQLVAKYRGIGGVVDSVCQYLEDRKLLDQHH